MIWHELWPFGKRSSEQEQNQRQQVAESFDHVVETVTRQRQEALAENQAAAEGFKKSVDERFNRSSPLREVLRKVIQRQREHHFLHH
jgi:hypothetical protein